MFIFNLGLGLGLGLARLSFRLNKKKLHPGTPPVKVAVGNPPGEVAQLINLGLGLRLGLPRVRVKLSLGLGLGLS